METEGGPMQTPVDDLVGREYTPAGRLLPADDNRTLFPLTGNPVRPGPVLLPARLDARHHPDLQGYRFP